MNLMDLLPQRFSTARFPRYIADLDESAGIHEDVLHLPNARVVLADYALLRQDFPQLGSVSAAGIDEWLVTHAAWISHAQAQQAVVNSPINVGEKAARAFRPPRYGRAVIVPVPGGLVDLKGAGVKPGAPPSHAAHSNGLEYVGTALGDFMLKSAIDRIFELAAPHFWSVPVYAILDLGFDIVNGFLGTAPAGMHVRRAHKRPPNGMALPKTGSREQMEQFEIEMILRSYGLTSTTVANSLEVVETDGRLEVYDGGVRVPDLSESDIAFFRALCRGAASARFERVNVQLSRGWPGRKRGELLDFGNYHVRPYFELPVCSTVNDRPFCLGPVMWPDHPDYIQPDPVLHVPAAVWHRTPNLNDFCFELAYCFRYNRCTQEQLVEQIEKPLRELLNKWSEPQTPISVPNTAAK